MFADGGRRRCRPLTLLVAQFVIGLWRGGTPIGICVEEFFRVQVRSRAAALSAPSFPPPHSTYATGGLPSCLQQRAREPRRPLTAGPSTLAYRVTGRSTVRSRPSRTQASAPATRSAPSK